ncbi:unnamed protein product, partial [Ectocarpus fasciculatus]
MATLRNSLQSNNSLLRVLVHGFISHETAANIGYETHKHEAATNLDPTAKGIDARVMYLTLAVLVVDRALYLGRKESDANPARIDKIWTALPGCTQPLKDLLLSRADDLEIPGSEGKPGEAFFDDRRLRYFH